VQVAPFASAALHVPLLASQYAFGAHWLSEVHVVLHVEFVPSHTPGAQLGTPMLPAVMIVHVPGVALHVSHASPHAVLQQLPSTQLPVLQSRQFATRQSLPALWSQALPWLFCFWQLPVASQYASATHALSEVHAVVHDVLEPLQRASVQGGLPGSFAMAALHVPRKLGMLQ
jgi:hypothetical protein